MSTDLHAALREAVADAPIDESDLQTVIDAGSRRLRRRAAFRVGASALLVVAAVLTSVVVGSDRSDQEPRPAHVVRLDLSRAQDLNLDVLTSVRTTWRDPANELDHDRFEGLTTDGLRAAQPVHLRRGRLRARFAGPRDREHGLVAAASGRCADRGRADRGSARAVREM